MERADETSRARIAYIVSCGNIMPRKIADSRSRGSIGDLRFVVGRCMVMGRFAVATPFLAAQSRGGRWRRRLRGDRVKGFDRGVEFWYAGGFITGDLKFKLIGVIVLVYNVLIFLIMRLLDCINKRYSYEFMDLRRMFGMSGIHPILKLLLSKTSYSYENHAR